MSHSVEKRLGHLIGILRKERLSLGDCAFKQENFIKSNQTHPFEGIAIGNDVCSLATISRLENGKHQNSYALLDYFLSKLGIKYKIRESLLEEEIVLLSRITSGFTSIPQTQLIEAVDDVITFYALYPKDILFMYNNQILNFVRSAILNQNPKRQEYDALLNTIEVYPKVLQHWLIECGLWLKQLHPDYWNLTFRHRDIYPAQLNKLHEILLRQGALENKNMLHSMILDLHNDSLVMIKLEEVITAIQNSNYQSQCKIEYQLCLLSALGISVTLEGESALFATLKIFNELLSPQDKLVLFDATLYGLLKHEPQPKAISKALSHTIIDLCQRTKTYKPLLKAVALLSEKRIEKKSSSLQLSEI